MAQGPSNRYSDLGGMLSLVAVLVEKFSPAHALSDNNCLSMQELQWEWLGYIVVLTQGGLHQIFRLRPGGLYTLQ